MDKIKVFEVHDCETKEDKGLAETLEEKFHSWRASNAVKIKSLHQTALGNCLVLTVHYTEKSPQ